MNIAANSQEIGSPLWVSAATEHQAIHALSQVGISHDAAVGIWVALKSKPAIVLCGPDGSGKKTFTLSVAKTIVGDTDGRLLQFQGHPWWATNGKNPGLFTRAQQQLTTYRLRAFLDEAVTAQTSANLFFAVFHKISRAELSSFLLPMPAHFPSGGLIRLPSDLADETTLLPGNVYLLATMDTGVQWSDPEGNRNVCVLFNLKTSLAKKPESIRGAPLTPTNLQPVLHASRRFDPKLAWKNVPIYQSGLDPLQPIRETYALLRRHGIRSHIDWIRDAYLYLGNAWSVTGRGLYAEDPGMNLNRAYLFWLQQAVMPALSRHILKDPDLGPALFRLLSRRSLRIPSGLEEILIPNPHDQRFSFSAPK